MIRPVTATLLFALLMVPITLTAQEKYIASYAGFAGFQAPLWAAKDFGLLAKYGVNTDLVMIPRLGKRRASYARRQHSLWPDRRHRADLGYQPRRGSCIRRFVAEQISI